MVRSKASMWRWRDGSSIRLGCSNRQRQYSRTPAGGNMADGWTCPYASKRLPTFEPAANKDGNGYMARSLSRWWDGKQARQSMLHASLAPPPQPKQRGRRIRLDSMCPKESGNICIINYLHWLDTSVLIVYLKLPINLGVIMCLLPYALTFYEETEMIPRKPLLLLAAFLVVHIA